MPALGDIALQPTSSRDNAAIVTNLAMEAPLFSGRVIIIQARSAAILDRHDRAAGPMLAGEIGHLALGRQGGY
jgi:hypothetical protein